MLKLFFPEVCYGCTKELHGNESVLCVSCRHSLPLCNFHTTGNEEMKRMFYGKVPVENAASLLYFRKKNITQRLIHQLKYKNAKCLGEFLGAWMGAELSGIPAYNAIDAVVPVPLHKKKLKQRGYNQVAGFAKEIANALQTGYYDQVLIKISATQTQVFKERLSRFFNQEEIFTLRNPEALKDKHIALVDDILTTGATLVSCASKLLQIQGTKISLVCMAITK